ncbi:hypothetical protein BP5796_06197 [Coleophoma crateriformis]|uniref:DUF676 domain-containing protein n=1 Tax=Coleophoma crateriformis TaxID=565419 RepID=A0A3D8RWE9_9HELO|nr:hypothetical protein BP5796_06197 [Coleophoma crateriformis]
MSSGRLCELYPSAGNLFDIFLHLLLLCIQIPFLISVPFWILLPFPPVTFVLGIIGFWTVNQSICYVLNGSKIEYQSDPKYAVPRKEHEHEQWVFLNGVAVGRHWLKSNVNRLALTFGRPVLGIHNKSNGILFDVIQCLIQRNFNYATQDIRDCYLTVKELLYRPDLTKIVFILHSQGGIEGGMVIDWLLQEVPQDLLAKLEVYTFGNAANHFNNPHTLLMSQHAALSHPSIPATTESRNLIHYHDAIPNGINGTSTAPENVRDSRQSTSGKAIRYIEHYANSFDYVARWGVSSFIRSYSPSAASARFMGRVFEQTGRGHLLNEHYLDTMFPLKRTEDGSGGIGNTGFLGADEEDNKFVESYLEIQVGRGKKHEVMPGDEREGLETSYCGTHGESFKKRPENGNIIKAFLVGSITPPRTEAESPQDCKEMECATNGVGATNGHLESSDEKIRFKVKDMSRLWLYRNGRCPRLDEVDFGVARMATM